MHSNWWLLNYFPTYFLQFAICYFDKWYFTLLIIALFEWYCNVSYGSGENLLIFKWIIDSSICVSNSLFHEMLSMLYWNHKSANYKSNVQTYILYMLYNDKIISSGNILYILIVNLFLFSSTSFSSIYSNANSSLNWQGITVSFKFGGATGFFTFSTSILFSSILSTPIIYEHKHTMGVKIFYILNHFLSHEFYYTQFNSHFTLYYGK